MTEVVVLEYHAKPDKAEQLAAMFSLHSPQIRHEDGCESLDIEPPRVS